ncbi:MAG TPA: class I SAM-dependent methyltransferase [Humisphaera sp.]|nr:class I SAM-dependent methyltransferase [Humisphaera sp.]
MAAPLWNHNFHYHDLLLSMAPSPCRAALDIGCGDGALVGKLTRRAERVIGIDTSAEMIERASTDLKARRTCDDAETSFIHGDFLTHPFANERFDFITCVATIHHMDFRAAVERMKSLLQPSGTIAILGLARTSGTRDFLYDAAGFLTTRMMRLRRDYFDPGAPIADPMMTFIDVERAASELLPGATFRRLVLFRYLLVWRSPEGIEYRAPSCRVALCLRHTREAGKPSGTLSLAHATRFCRSTQFGWHGLAIACPWRW